MIGSHHSLARRRIGWTGVLAVFIVMASVAFTVTNCATKHPQIVTVPGQVAHTANDILIRVQELQKATIDAEANKGVPTPVARIIITFTVEATKVLRVTPLGWGQTVAQLWATAKGQLPLAWLNSPVLQAVIMGVDVALAVFVPPTGGVS